ncbi:hypothetical protein SSX86_015218 [Deinandra increscens subsp. villosa]|uniref:F-box/LRR-repeat protein 15-like leucin rich repeat domain-containing protein n=1 Tax=Deinandra increscens subsp. villosa TaxID=3103831 RepID=A0AAP0GZ23_9ASTR
MSRQRRTVNNLNLKHGHSGTPLSQSRQSGQSNESRLGPPRSGPVNVEHLTGPSTATSDRTQGPSDIAAGFERKSRLLRRSLFIAAAFKRNQDMAAAYEITAQIPVVLLLLRRYEIRKKKNMGEDDVMVQQQNQLWSRETVPKVMKIISSRLRLPQRDIISLLLVSSSLNRTLVTSPSLWLVLDFHEMNNAGDRLLAALSLSRYHNVKQIILEFAQGIEDKHLDMLRNQFSGSLKNLEHLNLNGCQKISDCGIEAITKASPSLKIFSIYWNVRVTDVGISHLVDNCKHIVDLNLSGCKGISDKSLQMISECYQHLESLDITRCIKITDGGLQHIMLKCSGLQSLNLYALSSFTDEAYKKLSLLTHLRFLDLCGAQNLSDEGLFSIGKCKNIRTLNLTWCVRITDVGVIAIAQGCTSLEFLSLFGIVGVTDKCLEALSKSCSNTITTLDVNGCIGIKKRSREELLQLFPYVRCFKSLIDLLEEKKPKDVQEVKFEPIDRKGDQSSSSNVNGNIDNDDSEQNGKPQDYKIVRWAEDDQKNETDLGLLEAERNKRLESLMVRRRSKKHLGFVERGSSTGNDNNAQIPAAKTTKINPFLEVKTTKINPFLEVKTTKINPFLEDKSDGKKSPGSAPSSLLTKSNPFDIPYDPHEEKLDLRDNFHEEFTAKDPVFCRHQSFSIGAFSHSIFAHDNIHIQQDSPVSDEDETEEGASSKRAVGVLDEDETEVKEVDSFDERKADINFFFGSNKRGHHAASNSIVSDMQVELSDEETDPKLDDLDVEKDRESLLKSSKTLTSNPSDNMLNQVGQI